MISDSSNEIACDFEGWPIWNDERRWIVADFGGILPFRAELDAGLLLLAASPIVLTQP